MKHVLRRELAQADFHPQPTGLVQAAPVRLRACLLDAVALLVESQLIEADQELETTECLDVDIFRGVNMDTTIKVIIICLVITLLFKQTS